MAERIEAPSIGACKNWNLLRRLSQPELTIERYDVNSARVAGYGKRSKDIALVAVFLRTKTNIHRSVKRGQPWLVMLW